MSTLQLENRTPSYRLHRPSGQAVVTLNGRDFYLGKHGTTASRQTYDRLVAEWLVGGRAVPGRTGAGSRLTLSELIASYWHHAKAYYVKDGRPTGELPCLQQAVRPLRALYGRTPAAEFGPLALKAVRQRMIETNLCRNVVNRHVLRIKQLFKWATQNELLPPSVYHGLQAVTGLRKGRTEVRESTPVKPVPDEHVDAASPHLSRQVWAMVELQRLTGMRSGEVVLMRGRDLDTTGSIWLYRPESHKTEHHGHERMVELGPRAQANLGPFLKTDVDSVLFSPRDAAAEQRIERRRTRKSKVQPSQQDRSKQNPKRKPGDRYTANSYRRAIARACELAKVPHWHPHQLRHNYATRIRKEFGVEAARILLGHRSTAVTELYAEIDRGRVREIVSKVG